MARLTEEQAHKAIEEYNMARLGQVMSRTLKRLGMATPDQIGVNTQEDYDALCTEIKGFAHNYIDIHGSNIDVHGPMAVAAEAAIERRAAK